MSIYDQAIADVDHRFDLQSKIGELRTKAIDVNVEAFRVQWFVGAPDLSSSL